MALNWKALAPHRPLDPGEAGYVVPPSGYAERVARLVLTGTSTVLVGGPVGVGKSTELAQIAALLKQGRVACLVQVDRSENIRRLTPDQLLLRIAGELVEMAFDDYGVQVSLPLLTALRRNGTLAPIHFGAPVAEPTFTGSPLSLLNAARSEVARATGQTRIALVIDGLEKMPDTPESHAVLSALGQISDEVDIITVVPWFVAFGTSEDAVRHGAVFAPCPAPEVDGPRGAAGRQFLVDILTKRLGLPPERLDEDEATSAGPRRATVLEAIRWSGGLPRTFLQLMADAAQYAQIRRGDEWPDDHDLADAVADQKDSFRRALLPGDTAAILKVDATDGREMELGRKIRLLARGIILERRSNGGYVMDIHPLVRPLLEGKTHA
jgi:hypothetical protein